MRSLEVTSRLTSISRAVVPAWSGYILHPNLQSGFSHAQLNVHLYRHVSSSFCVQNGSGMQHDQSKNGKLDKAHHADITLVIIFKILQRKT